MTPVTKKRKDGLPQGWMGRTSLRWLRTRGLGITGYGVEVGSWRGRSTQALTAAMRRGTRLYAVDTWAGVPEDPTQHDRLYAGAGDVYGSFLKNCARAIRKGNLKPLRMTSLDGAAYVRERHGLRSLDFVFIDADHRYEAVNADIEAWGPLVKPGGILAGHDLHWEGVARAVSEHFGEAFEKGPGSIWYVRAPKAAS